MFAFLNCLQQHDPRLVAWAVVICVVAVTASLNAYRRAASTEGGLRAAWIIMVALLLGSGVWATHFMSMLAYQQDMMVRFGLNLTALSYLVAVGGIGAGTAVAAISDTARGRALGGALCGVSISAMHFIGVSAMQLAADMQWDPVMVVAAIAISVTAAPVAMLLAAEGSHLGRKAGAVLAMVVAIAGLHFTAMAAVTLIPVDRVVAEGLQGGRDLALVIGALAGLILTAGVAMLVSDRIARNLSSLRSALDSAPAAIAAFDAEGRLTFWSQSYQTFLKSYGIVARQGLPMGQIISKGREAARSEKRHGRQATHTQELIAPDGRSYQGRMQMDRGGGFVVVLTDITEQQQLSQREAAARQLAEDASQAKSEFLANMSHEIRTPLNGVLGMVQVMDRDPLAPEQRKRLEVIGEAGQALLVLLNNILDLSKIEAGKLELETYPFDLKDIVTQSAAAHAPLAVQKDLTFRIDIAPEALGSWNGDGGKLRQVLTNLVSNALKFTSEGAIDLCVRPAPGGLTFEVRDTGVGIAPDKLEVVFEQFSQADASTTRRYGGTGLGLSICRELTELMGGELTLESAPGQGSTFRFTLPLTAAQATPGPVPVTAPEAQASSQTLRILAAEDNPTNQLILRALLQPLDIDLVIVADGRDAVEASMATPFDLILMDIQMPEMNGLEATAEIRRREREAGVAHVPIIALTANVMRHQIDEYLAAGMVGFVAKPINARVLMQAMETALASPAEADARLSA